MLETKLTTVVNKIKAEASEVEIINGSEEDLVQRVERLLDSDIWNPLGIKKPKYEYEVDAGVRAGKGRLDALYGMVIFEYKKPGMLKKPSVREEAKEKLRKTYIPGLLLKDDVKKHIKIINERGHIPIIAGIIFDGYDIIFVNYFPQSQKFEVNPEVGTFELNEDNLRRIIRIVVATSKKKIDARVLASDFGYRSSIISSGLLNTFYKKLENPHSEKTKKLHKEWLKLTSQAFNLSGNELEKIAHNYGVVGKVDGTKLFFAIQTYYAFIIKLLSLEVAARFYDSSLATFFEDLKEAIAGGRLKEKLEMVETGYLYSIFGIRNFLEGEFFSWYLAEWDDEIEASLKLIIEKLVEYDIESIVQEPANARDVFKLLYEELVPRKEIRQKLGIYTTPDWLAEFLIEETIIKENFTKSKILDPACGTGTFLTLVIKKIAREKKEKSSEFLNYICNNVIGFDIDSLSILTSRANYLIALASEGLLENKGVDKKIEIPVYLANSVISAIELEDTVIVGEKTVKVVDINAGEEDFQIPKKLLPVTINILNEFKEFIEGELPFDNLAVKNSVKKYNLNEEEKVLIENVYKKLLKFKEDGVDGVWIPILKSYIVSTYHKNFDFIVGNPPWISYRYITSVDYQKKIKKQIMDDYKLVLEEKLITQIDMATLFLIRCMDLYLKDGGFIGFVMPKSIKYSDQHNNFRRGSISSTFRYMFNEWIDCEVEPLFNVPTCAVILQKQ